MMEQQVRTEMKLWRCGQLKSMARRERGSKRERYRRQKELALTFWRHEQVDLLESINVHLVLAVLVFVRLSPVAGTCDLRANTLFVVGSLT